jgi:hypothetical protein
MKKCEETGLLPSERTKFAAAWPKRPAYSGIHGEKIKPSQHHTHKLIGEFLCGREFFAESISQKSFLNIVLIMTGMVHCGLNQPPSHKCMYASLTPG